MMKPPPNRKTVKDYKSILIQNRLGISKSTFSAWMMAGKFPGAYKAGKSYYVPKEDVEKFLNNNTKYREIWDNVKIPPAGFVDEWFE